MSFCEEKNGVKILAISDKYFARWIHFEFLLNGLIYKGVKKFNVRLPAKYLSKMARIFTLGFFHQLI